MAPVVAKAAVIAVYAVPAVVAYRHVAFWLVTRLIVPCLVPAVRVPVGAPFDRSGGVALVVDWAEIAERPNNAKAARITKPQTHFRDVAEGCPPVDRLLILHSLEIPPAGEFQRTEQDDHHVRRRPEIAYLADARSTGLDSCTSHLRVRNW